MGEPSVCATCGTIPLFIRMRAPWCPTCRTFVLYKRPERRLSAALPVPEEPDHE